MGKQAKKSQNASQKDLRRTSKPPLSLFETLFHTLAEPVLVLDTALSPVEANPALYQLLRIAPEELGGKLLRELFSEKNAQPGVKAMLEALIAGGDSLENVVFVCRVAPRTQKTLCMNAHRISVETYPSPLLLVELRDISQERQTKRRAEKLSGARLKHGDDMEGINKELESFSHSVSHDLRMPLRLISKTTHLLLQEHGEQLPTAAARQLRTILESTQEMGKLIEDLLRFSKVIREPMKTRSVDFRRLAREALDELLQAEAQDRKIKVTVGKLPSCRADRAMMKQVFLNLAANALKFTRPRAEAEIEVGASRSEGKMVYYIRDNGVGFEQSEAEVMFVPFHRLHKKHFEGSGVGLALVKRIIERHSGRVWAEGQVDGGATFFFSVCDPQ